MGTIIAVVNQKGGVGKTTTSINLAAALADENKKVLLIDLDPQANATSGLGFDYTDISNSIYEVLIGHCDASSCVIDTKRENFYILPAAPSLAGASVEMVGMEQRERIMLNHLTELKTVFDYIIVDCPPSLGILTVNALVAADSVMIPVQAEYYALEGLGQLMNTVGLIQDNLKNELTVLGAVVTMFDRRNRIAKQVVEELHNYFPYHVFDTVIPRNVRLTEAPSHGQTIIEYEGNSNGARAYMKLAEEVITQCEGEYSL